MSENTAITVADGETIYEPRSIDQAFEIARTLHAGGLLPRALTRPESVFTVLMAGKELGLTALKALRSIHVIDGKVVMSADLIVALCKSRRDVCKYFQLVESSSQVATYETQREGDPAPTRITYTLDDARTAGLVGKDNWKKHPAAMLRARCSAALARAVYPDLAMGLYDPDELERDTALAAPRREVVEVRESSGEFTEFAAALDSAADLSSVNRIVTRIAAAHKSGRITDGQLASLKRATVAKRAALAPVVEAVPETPKSAPRNVIDEAHEANTMDAAEAEADVFAGAYS